MTRQSHVLIVEDDADIVSALSRGLSREGYTTEHAADPAAARACLDSGRCDAAIVDVMLGEESGLDIVEAMRAGGFRAPVIVLSALGAVEDRSRGLAAGADDYVVKPFEFAELVARLRVQEARRSTPALRHAGLTLSAERRVARAGEDQIALTEREAALLSLFLANAERVLSRAEIFDALWAGDGGSSENVVDVYVGYLRRKLATLPAAGVALRTLRSRGFLLTAEV